MFLLYKESDFFEKYLLKNPLSGRSATEWIKKLIQKLIFINMSFLSICLLHSRE